MLPQSNVSPQSAQSMQHGTAFRGANFTHLDPKLFHKQLSIPDNDKIYVHESSSLAIDQCSLKNISLHISTAEPQTRKQISCPSHIQ